VRNYEQNRAEWIFSTFSIKYLQNGNSYTIKSHPRKYILGPLTIKLIFILTQKLISLSIGWWPDTHLNTAQKVGFGGKWPFRGKLAIQFFFERIDDDINSRILSKFYANRNRPLGNGTSEALSPDKKSLFFSRPFWPLLIEVAQSFQVSVPSKHPSLCISYWSVQDCRGYSWKKVISDDHNKIFCLVEIVTFISSFRCFSMSKDN